MRDFAPATAAFLAARPTALRANVLIWITARDRVTGLPETLGLWDGPDHENIVVNGVSRAYFGAGSILGLESLVYGSVLDVRLATLKLSQISDEVEQAIRGYDARLASIEVHRIIWDSVTNTMQGPAHRILNGQIDAIVIDTPAEDSSGGVTVTIASAARALTRTLALRRDDESQRRRGDDRIRRYATLSGVVSTPWGEK